MAVLKALTKLQRERIEAAKPAKVQPVLINSDAHVQAYRDHLVANFNGKVKVISAGKSASGRVIGPLKAQKFFQPDYRSFVPKGVVLVAPKLRGTCQRFGVR